MLPIAPMIRIEEDSDGVQLTDRAVKWAFNMWNKNKLRYQTLRDYYLGRQAIEKKEGARVCVNMCKYTTDSIIGYMVGNPTTYTYDADDRLAEEVINLLKAQNSPQTDKEVLTLMSIYGRAYRLVYHADDDSLTPKSTVFSPLQAFVCYTGTVEPESLFGAVVYAMKAENGGTAYFMDVYTRNDVQRWTSRTGGSWIQEGQPKPHKFGRVPLVEYKNSMDYLGDFDQIMDLQDAYNSVMSDRQDDKDAFSSAMLLIKGAVLGATPDELEEGEKFLKKHKILQTDDDTSVEYLTKQMSEADVQVFTDALMRDMHKIAKVPNLSDENFASNSSGVAMMYKLYGTEMLAGDKAINFQKAQTYLFKLYDAGLHNALGRADYRSSIDFNRMRVIFRYSVPTDISYEAQSIATYKSTGIISDRTLREHCSLIDDPEVEEERVAEQVRAEMDNEKLRYADEFGLSE